MSNQAAVHSIEALKDLRVALALFSEDALSALGAVEMEARRTVQWLQHDRRMYWQDQLKRRREQVASAQAELFRRQLGKRPDSSPSCGEQKELLRRAEASLHDAEMRSAMVKKWDTALQQAVFEYHGSIRRIKDLSSGDVPRAMLKLERMVDALEAYLRVTPPSGRGEASASPLESIANTILDEEPEPEPEPVPTAEEPGPIPTPTPAAEHDEAKPSH
ncbi:hypothetical protein SAMN05444166_0421 [Singulisphaera sp. GP187]|uniref:hypothetical protein n=1 Tax=Singulisphaera sp. GP187 TaxID=1882752 RepID=UPI00092A007B|nr:hypothetical protein [Singulisphaera sp. GP187]SIN72112.1 hypothetical protein SAMN05444166_0421 [Singulisphaera sp. GP187]